MHHINSIVNIQPYTITVIFDNKEQRIINFESILEDFPVLKNPIVFNAIRENGVSDCKQKIQSCRNLIVVYLTILKVKRPLHLFVSIKKTI